ncbi:chromo domain-containing protein [Rutstroemia sp. NJR-2017a BVV2]|nr:chromo domain-containing protein [Rutstroemia sp. NJR-2017a BVV2]PQE18387.1 chromo domain-containing protein [Rutstroemia sp. NJR-2017a BVV2]
MSSNIVVEIKENPALLSNTKPTKSSLQFDFRVAERPTYKPNSGPSLQPITLTPSHDKDGYIIDFFPYPKPEDPNHFLVGFERQPNVQLLVHPKNIRDYVSDFTLEIWEYKRSSEEEDRLVEQLQPILIASEKRRKLYMMKKAGVSRDIIMGLKRKQEDEEQPILPRKRGKPPKSMASVFMPQPQPPKDPDAKRSPGRPRKTITAPIRQLSQHSIPSLSDQPSLSQPSLSQAYLSTPSRALLESAIADAYMEDDDEDTELALSRQLIEEANQHSGSSSSVTSGESESSSPVLSPSRQGHMITSREPALQKAMKSKLIQRSPHHRPKPAPILPGMTADAYPYSASFSYKNIPAKKSAALGRPATSKQSSLVISPTSGKVTFRDTKQTSSVHTTQGKSAETIFPSLKATGILSDSRTTAALRHISAPTDANATSHDSPHTNSQHSGVDSDEGDDTSDDGLAHDSNSPPAHFSTGRSRILETNPNDDADELSQGHYEKGEAAGSQPPSGIKSILSHDKKEGVMYYLIDWEGNRKPSWKLAKGIAQSTIDRYWNRIVARSNEPFESNSEAEVHYQEQQLCWNKEKAMQLHRDELKKSQDRQKDQHQRKELVE